MNREQSLALVSLVFVAAGFVFLLLDPLIAIGLILIALYFVLLARP